MANNSISKTADKNAVIETNKAAKALGRLAAKHLRAAEAFGKKSTREIWLAGKYLAEAKALLGHNRKGLNYGTFVESLGISGGSAANAVKVFKHFASELEAAKVGITEAYYACGAYTTKPEKPKPSEVTTPDEGTQTAFEASAPEEDLDLPTLQKSTLKPSAEAAEKTVGKIKSVPTEDHSVMLFALSQKLEKLASSPPKLTKEDRKSIDRAIAALTKLKGSGGNTVAKSVSASVRATIPFGR